MFLPVSVTMFNILQPGDEGTPMARCVRLCRFCLASCGLQRQRDGEDSLTTIPSDQRCILLFYY